MSVKNCLLCGVGGQGTVLASKLIAFCAMQKNMEVRTSETIGMAQRGGSVVSHVRTGKNINSSLIPKHSADVLIAFEPGEAVRNLDYLSQEGVVIVNSKAVVPTSANFGAVYDGEEMLDYLKNNVRHLVIVDGEKICNFCNSAKILNVSLLTVAAMSGMLDMTCDELKDTIKKRVSEKFQALNFKAIDYTIECYKNNF